ncbi:MAG: DUF4829 domain-containing protein [Arachnia sp.]
MANKAKQFMAPLLGLAAILVVVAIYLMATMPSKDVDMPSDDASPDVVVAAYMEALDAGDCETAKALVVPSNHTSAQTWCSQVASLSDTEVATPVPEPAGLSNPTSLRTEGKSVTSREVVDVRVKFTLKRSFSGRDMALPDGRNDWGYLLQRESPEEPWRIFDEGNG